MVKYYGDVVQTDYLSRNLDESKKSPLDASDAFLPYFLFFIPW